MKYFSIKRETHLVKYHSGHMANNKRMGTQVCFHGDENDVGDNKVGTRKE